MLPGTENHYGPPCAPPFPLRPDKLVLSTARNDRKILQTLACATGGATIGTEGAGNCFQADFFVAAFRCAGWFSGLAIAFVRAGDSTGAVRRVADHRRASGGKACHVSD